MLMKNISVIEVVPISHKEILSYLIYHKQINKIVLDYNAGSTSIAEYKNKLKEKLIIFN